MQNKLVRKAINFKAWHGKLREAQLRWKGHLARKEDSYAV